MNDIDPTKPIGTMDILELKALRDAASKKIGEIRRKKYKKLNVYVPAELSESFGMALRWANAKRLTKKPTEWAFAQFAVVNTIRIILDEIKAEQAAGTLPAGIEAPQISQDAKYPPGDTTQSSKPA